VSAGRKPLRSWCSPLSDWEIEEARLDWERGRVTLDALASRYEVSAKTLQRAFKRMDERRARSDGTGRADDDERRPMASNTMGRLTDALFAELERLEQVDASDRDALRAEIDRSRAVQGIAKELNESAKTILDTARYRAEWAGARTAAMPKMLEE